MQCIPQISNSDGVPNIYLPLALVLLVSAIKDGVEDSKRKKSDREENDRTVLRLDENLEWEKVKWEELHVGNKIRLFKNEFIPADILLLSTSHTNGA